MSTASDQVQPTVHRFAVLTCLVALLPIGVGALVTTLKAGMAFADWPTSDGQNMLMYPWLSDLRHTDKFVEHGHRLAGVLIGIVSIALVWVCFLYEQKTWVRRYSIAILIAVIAQGLLGGMRVRMNEQVLAMTHSITGALFFTMCFLFASLTRARACAKTVDRKLSPVAVALSALFPIAVLGQYVLGGLFRHLHSYLYEHVAGAVCISLLAMVLLTLVLRSDLAQMRQAGRWVLAAFLLQVSLGLGAWVTKLGFAQLGWVATVNSVSQNVVCSLHTVGGMFLLATSTLLAVTTVRLARAGMIPSVDGLFSAVPAVPPRKGGLA